MQRATRQRRPFARRRRGWERWNSIGCLRTPRSSNTPGPRNQRAHLRIEGDNRNTRCLKAPTLVVVLTVATDKLLGERAILVSGMTRTPPSCLTLTSPATQRIPDALSVPGTGGRTVVEGAVLASPTLAAVTLAVEAGAVEETSWVAGLGVAVRSLPSGVALALAIHAPALLATPGLARRWKRKIHTTRRFKEVE